MAHDKDRTELAALDALLDVHGGDEARWPVAAVERFASLIARNAQAQRLVAEAKALDRLLVEADDGDARPASRHAALADRIMAATDASAPPVAGGNVVGIGNVREAVRRPVAPRQSWQAAALLAASLVAGLYVGSGLGTSPLLADVAERLGIGQLVEPTVALISDAAGEREEEWL